MSKLFASLVAGLFALSLNAFAADAKAPAAKADKKAADAKAPAAKADKKAADAKPAADAKAAK